LRLAKTFSQENYGATRFIAAGLKGINTMIQKLLVRSFVVILAGSILAGLTGCVFSLGGSKEVTSSHATRGQELIDLKKARDQGAITPEEYEAKRRQILDR
jgi:hypothetical protein